MVNFREFDFRFLDDVFEWLAGPFEKINREFFELRASDGLVEVGGAVFSEGQVGKLNGRTHRGRKFLLGLLGRLLESLLGDFVTGHIDTGRLFELLGEVVDESRIPVVSTEAVVARGCTNLDGREVVVLAHFEKGHVEGSASKVEDEDEFVFFALVEAVRECGCGGLVDNAQNVESSNLTGFFGRLALSVVEVRGNGDDGVRHFFTEVRFGVALELAEDSRRDFLRGVLLVVDFLGPRCSDVTLDRGDGAVNVRDGLTLCGFTDENFAVLGERDDRGCGAEAFRVGDDGGFSTFKYGDDRVGRSEVNSNSSCHCVSPFSPFRALVHGLVVNLWGLSFYRDRELESVCVKFAPWG